MSLKKGLGKGLGALINDSSEDFDESLNNIIEIDINKIEPNKKQPRKTFDEKSLIELADSIKEIGIIQPIIVKKENDFYIIIAGERRWRAARIAKLKKVPVIVREYDELESLEITLIENIQREDLNPLEEAFTYKRLNEEFNLSQEDIAIKVGKSRVTITNSIRLLNLDKRVQNLLIELKLTSGHARALLAITDKDKQFEVAEKIIAEQLSVRDTELLIKKYVEGLSKPKELKPSNENNKIYNNIESDLKNIFGTKVIVKNGKNKGKIEIEYYSNDELDRLVCMFKQIH